MTHTYKVTEGEFARIESETKTFDILKDDKGIKIGDDIIFQASDADGGYTGDEWKGTVSELKDSLSGQLKKGFCAIVFKAKE